MGSQRVRHNWATNSFTFPFFSWVVSQCIFWSCRATQQATFQPLIPSCMMADCFISQKLSFFPSFQELTSQCLKICPPVQRLPYLVLYSSFLNPTLLRFTNRCVSPFLAGTVTQVLRQLWHLSHFPPPQQGCPEDGSLLLVWLVGQCDSFIMCFLNRHTKVYCLKVLS